MAHKAQGRGSYRLDRIIGGVGRIRAPSRIYVPEDFDELDKKLIPLLEERGRLDLLIGLRDRIVFGDELLRKYREEGLKGLPNLEHAKPLKVAWAEWLKRAEIADRTRRDYKEAGERLIALATTPDVSVAALPGLLRLDRDELAGGRTFNKDRAAARSFASSLTGRYNPLWVELSNIKPRRPRKRQSHPQTPDGARAIATKLGPRHGPMFWTMCCTGMSGGPDGPYFLDRFTVRDDRILIHGTKTEGRERIVPRITTPIRAMTKYQAHRKALRKLGLAPNDGRKTFAHWLEQCRDIPRTQRRRLLGHGRRDVTDIYEDFPIEPYLAEITLALKAYVGQDWAPALEMVG